MIPQDYKKWTRVFPYRKTSNSWYWTPGHIVPEEDAQYTWYLEGEVVDKNPVIRWWDRLRPNRTRPFPLNRNRTGVSGPIYSTRDKKEYKFIPFQDPATK